ncbi:hypothetical protein B7Y94_00585 [Candidatus Saccharibacteria bacterium 32-49-12]|nr:MAG: hypothetical protein B7Y94_00585 [Candidatus Saccharibacteria bacterium 32-49-12]
MNEGFIYLDHAAATPVDPLVLDSMLPYFSELFFNPSSPYAQAVKVKRDYTEAKRRIAQNLGVQADELVMTAGATESINIAFSAARGKILVSSVEHSATLSAAKKAGDLIKIPANNRGRISPESLSRLMSPDVTFVSVGLVNNELGTVQPIEDIGRIIEVERQRRIASGENNPLIFHCDASQATALIDIKIKRLGVDLLTLSAAKVYGPKQVGLLWVKPGILLAPTIVGGGQENGLRSGTENVAGVIGFATALELASKRRSGERQRLQNSSDSKKGLVNFLHISFPGLDAERLIFWLESRGVMVATGSACAANKGTRSHILEAIGMDDRAIQGSLRISLGRLSTEENIENATRLIIEAVNLEQARVR